MAIKNDKIKSGLFFNSQKWSIEIIKYKGKFPKEQYPGYRRIPSLAMLVLGPLMGGAFVIFLPVLGFVLITGLTIKKLVQMAKQVGIPYKVIKVKSEAK